VTDAANRIVQKLWSYCNVLTRRMTRADLDESVACYRPGQRQKRKATWSLKNPKGRWRAFG
jgi:hypothetical protein